MTFTKYNTTIYLINKKREGDYAMIKTNLLKTELEQKNHDALLADLYADETLVPVQRARYIKAIEQFENVYGAEEVEIYSAPGRSEIGGNHTDHQQGRVLAASVNVDFIAVVGKVEEPVIKILSEGYDMITVELNDLALHPEDEGTTKALIKGIVAGLQKEGYEVNGFEGYITSDVLSGSGLSSSAGFETIIGCIISGLFNNGEISPVKIAQIGQYAENVYFNKPSGLMDQMASSVGDFVFIDFKDSKEPVVEKIDVDFESKHYSLCIVDTKGSHDDLTDEYASVPLEMKKIANEFGKAHLREVDVAEFYAKIPALREACGDRAVLRAIHFFNENERVLQQAEALKEGRMDDFLHLVKESGNSSFKFLQNIYVSSNVTEQNMSIALAVSESILGDNGVCRVHGGGFAGTIQAFVKNDFVSEYKEKIEAIFGSDSCNVLKVRKYGGRRVL